MINNNEEKSEETIKIVLIKTDKKVKNIRVMIWFGIFIKGEQ